LIPDKPKLNYAEEGSEKEEELVFAQRRDMVLD
jgi:hypothetical protein